MRPTRIIAVTAIAAALSALALAAAVQPATAATPCWRQVINDWVDNDQIDGTYPLHCYRDAIAHVPEDLKAYSSIVDDITSARQQRVRATVRRPTAFRGGKKKATRPTPAASSLREPERPLFRQAFDKLGPRNVDSVPLPLLILAGLALLLIAAGAAGLVARRLRARRIGPPAG